MDVHPIVSGPFFGAQLAGRFLACYEVGLVAVSGQMLGEKEDMVGWTANIEPTYQTKNLYL
jgi:hypothetical protein